MVSLIELENLSKVYEGESEPVHALRSVSLTISEGDYVAVTGPSGSGKSTLLNIIGGLDTPSSGKCVVAGRNLPALGDYELTRFRRTFVGFVFQAFNLISDMTLVDNVALPLYYAGVTKRERTERAVQALQSVGLAKRARAYPSSLSGGEQQRVAIARAIVHKPQLLLADEPTGNVDSATQDQILGIFDSINTSGRTIVVVTHNPVVAEKARRVVQIIDGVIASCSGPLPSL